MRALRKNKQTLYYALYDREIVEYDEEGNETGDPVKQYEKPIKFKANTAPNKGNAYAQPFGLDLDYTKAVLTTDKLPIKEGTLIWHETEPPITANDGSTADYMVVRVAKSLNNITVYALKSRVKNG